MKIFQNAAARKARAEDTTKHLLYDLPQIETEIGMLFGARCVSGDIARHAAKLYKDGQFKKLVIAGGLRVRQREALWAIKFSHKKFDVNEEDFLSKEKEADYMHQILLEEGVNPDDIIFVDRDSAHTQENIKNCAHVLNEAASVTIVCAAYHQRRVLGTLRKNLEANPDILATSAPVYPFGLTKENWADSPFSGIVYGERSKIDVNNPKSYIAKGYCAEVDVFAETERLYGHQYREASPKFDGPKS